MSGLDLVFGYGVAAGALLGAIVATGVALLFWQDQSDRIERLAGSRGFRDGRRAEREEHHHG